MARIPTMATARSRANMPGLLTGPALHEMDLVDLPTLSCEVAYKIAGAFEALARSRGLGGGRTRCRTSRRGDWSFTLVDDPSMLFNDNRGRRRRCSCREVIENCPVDG